MDVELVRLNGFNEEFLFLLMNLINKKNRIN